MHELLTNSTLRWIFLGCGVLVAVIDVGSKFRESKPDKEVVSKRKKITSIVYTALKAFIILILGVFSVSDYLSGELEKKLFGTKGKLRLEAPDIAIPKVSLGGSGAILAGVNGDVTLPNAYNSDPLFRVWVKDGFLKINCNIRDKNLNYIASIKGNTWDVCKCGYDYNNNDTAFELVTIDERVVFQVKYHQGTDVIDVAGLFYTNDSTAYYIHPSQDTARLGGLIDIYRPEKRFVLPSNQIKLFFKYPRVDYLGVVAE